MEMFAYLGFYGSPESLCIGYFVHISSFRKCHILAPSVMSVMSHNTAAIG